MLSISSIFTAISGSIGALRKTPETSAPGNSIAKHAEAVDDVVSLSGQGIKAARHAQTGISSRATERKADSPTANEPDGKQYAIGGEISIEKARATRAAALAPADPSPQDRAVAVQAARIEAEAHQRIAAQETSTPYSNIAPSYEARRSITLYQETSGIHSLVAQPPSFRTTA